MTDDADDDRMFLANARAAFRQKKWRWFTPERAERLINLAATGVAWQETKKGV